jgi:hypothetical protein
LGNNIWLDPKFHPYIETDKGWIRSSTKRMLAHELGHTSFGTLDDGYREMNNINLNESPVMRELRYPIRIRYEGIK